MHRFTLRQLEYLVACIEHGSIARAAEVLHVAQPTISVAISKLEDQFGVQLLLRHHSQGVTATASAERILSSARGLLGHASDLQRQAMATGTSVAGELRLGSFITLAPVILPGLISSLAQKFPQISLALHEGTQEFLLDGLLAGRLDVALLYDLNLPQGLRKTSLAAFPPYVALPAGHSLCAKPQISLADLARMPMILLDVPPSRDYFLGLFQAEGLTPTVAYSSPSLELVRGMVGRGLGFSLLVTRPGGDMTYDGKRIEVRPLTGNPATSQIILASLAGLRPTELLSSFERTARQFFPAQPID
ncbi:MAG: LysR family transcriptional regulator [Rhodobacterales bacterium]|jgi:DNA-binding transcriptional LysR family regulator|nr:LysR family transcriptional regulator [Pseudomonadota bacterium]MDA1284883.1 LysR family transcriptional regulator [Pseudomonadota bacterium]